MDYLKIVYELLEEDKSKIPFLVILFLLTSFIDALSIAILLPFIQILVNIETFEETYGWILNYFSLNSKSQIITFTGVMLILIFVIKALASVLVNFSILKIMYNRQAKIRKKLLHKYLNMDYKKYIEGNSARYIQILGNINTQYVKVLQAFLKLLSDGLIFISIIAVLAYIQGPLLLSVAVILVLFLIIYDVFFKTILDKQSQAITNSGIAVTKIINEAIQGLKEIKILSKQKFFEELAKKNLEIYAKNNIYSDLIRTQPRYLVELLFVVFFILAVILMDPLQNNFQNAIPTLGVFLFAVIRLLPSMNQMLASIGVIRSGLYPVSVLSEDMLTKQELEKIDQNNIKEDFQSMSLKDIYFSYKGDQNYQINGISINVEKNKSIGLFGQSGSGKTTLVDIMLGLLEPEKGEIKLNNKKIKNNQDFRNFVAYIPQDIFIINDSIQNNITLSEEGEKIDKDLLKEVIVKSRLSEVVNKLPEGINTNIGERGVKLSGGQKQRIAIARALFNKKEVLIMDEATSALDNETEKEIIDEIKKLKGRITMIVIAHRLTTLQHCDEIYEISNGRISEKYNYEDISKSKK